MNADSSNSPQKLDLDDLENIEEGKATKNILKCCCMLLACGCVIFMFIIVGSFLSFNGITPDKLTQTNQYSSVEDCLEDRFGSKGGLTGACSYNGPDINSASRTNIDTVVRYLSAKGFNKNAIAGIIGNWVQESVVDPTNCQDSCENSSGGNTPECAKDIYNCGYGLAQWTSKGRKTNLVNFASKQNKSADNMQLQLDFFMWEVNKSFSNLLKEINKDSTPEEAVYTFEEIYENAGSPAYSSRVSFANSAFEGISCSSSTSANNASKTDDNKVEINSIPYFNQQDYKTPIPDWNSTIAESGCGITCAAMISSFVNEKENKPDTYYKEFGASHIDSLQNSTGLKILTNETPWDFVNNKDENWEKIKTQISKGNPVMIFTGYSETHIILIVGYNLNNDGSIKEVIINDPYNNFYDNNQRNADHVYYPFDDLNKYLTTYKHAEGSKVYFLDFSRPSAVNSTPQYEQWMVDECEEILKNQSGSTTGSLLSSCNIPEIKYTNGNFDHIYLHWTGGTYENDPSLPYHITIDDKGKIYQNHEFEENTKHTAFRNTNAIGISLLAMQGYKPGQESDVENGYGSPYPPTDIQIETMAKVVANIASHYKIPIDEKHIMTHAECASNKDYPKELVTNSSPPNVSCKPCEPAKNEIVDGDPIANQDGLPHCNYGPNWEDGWPTGSWCRWDLWHHGDILRSKAKQCISSTSSASSANGNLPHFCQQIYQDPQGNPIEEGHDGCGPTSLLMILKYYGLASDQTVYSFYHDFEDPGGYGHNVNTNPSQLKAQAEKFTPSDANLCWHTGLSVENIIQRAKEGKPTQVGTLYFKNKYNSNSSGHYVAIKGFTQIDGKDALIASDSACWGKVPDNANEILYLDQHAGLDGKTLPGFFDQSHWPDDNFVIYATPCN